MIVWSHWLWVSGEANFMVGSVWQGEASFLMTDGEKEEGRRKGVKERETGRRDTQREDRKTEIA